MSFAEVVLGLFIPLSIGSFYVLRPLAATMAVVLGGSMFLPEMVSFKFPLMPPLSKQNLPYLCAAIGCMLTCRRRFSRAPKRARIAAVAFAMTLTGLATALTNADGVMSGPTMIPGLTLKDGFYISAQILLPSCLAFYLGHALVREREDVEKVLMSFGIAGLIYCPFAIIEMRMAPQVHYWIYGMDTGAFDQAIRYGGYRPKVCMTHGLTLARYFTNSTFALFLLARTRRSLFGFPTRLLAWFQFVVLVLCRSTGAVLTAVVGLFLITKVKPKRQIRFAMIVSFVTLLYPLLRSWDLFPTTQIVSAFGDLSTDRAGSLEFRFMNEDLLLARARERPVFGWGFLRHFVFTEEGGNLTTVDGYWIIAMGVAGTAGFVLTFILLLWPVIWARWRLRKHGEPADYAQLASVAVMVALWTADMIPNGLWLIYEYLLAGVLYRRLTELNPTPIGASARRA